jgi:hypothetical protein
MKPTTSKQRRLRAKRLREARARPALVVHLLRYGATLCQRPGLPDTWPAQHRFVTDAEHLRHAVTCGRCRVLLAHGAGPDSVRASPGAR